MSTRNLISSFFIGRAVLVLALCGITALSGFAADRNDDRDNNSNSDRKEVHRDQRQDNKRSDDRAKDCGTRGDRRGWSYGSQTPATDRQSDNKRPSRYDSRSWWPNVQQDKRDTNRDRSSEWNGWNRDNSRNRHDDDNSVRNNRSWPSTREHVESRPARVENRPARYQLPVLRSGRYYYSERPAFRPLRYGHWVFNDYGVDCCRKSAYFHFGYFPYVAVARVRILPYVTITYINRPVRCGSDYYLSSPGGVDLEEALSDIRKGWLDGRLDLIERHVYSGHEIAVMLDGRYDYSLDPDDYNNMTSDALDQIQTISFAWETVRQRSGGDITAFGRHTFHTANGDTKTIYVSYNFRRIAGDYMITEVGSSSSPLD